MAGQRPLVTQHYPDDFQVMLFEVDVGKASSGTSWFFADRDFVVDSIWVGVHEAGQAGSIVKFQKLVGTLAVPAVPTDANFASSGIYICTNSAPLGAAGTFQLNMCPFENIVPAGSWLGFEYTGNVTNFKGTIQARIRSRIA